MRPTRTAAIAASLLVAAGVSAAHVSAQPSSEPSPSPSPSAEAAPPPGPKTTIDADGTYAVGTDIVPGVYSSAGPTPDGACYWKRVAGGEMLDNALTKKPAVVQILANDTSFTTNDCQAWALTPNAPLPRQAGPGELLSQLAPMIGPSILGGGPSGPPSAGSAPAAEAPAAEAPAEHMPATSTAPGPG